MHLNTREGWVFRIDQQTTNLNVETVKAFQYQLRLPPPGHRSLKPGVENGDHRGPPQLFSRMNGFKTLVRDCGFNALCGVALIPFRAVTLSACRAGFIEAAATATQRYKEPRPDSHFDFHLGETEWSAEWG